MRRAVERLGRSEGVVHIALMPDAHLAEHVCVGTVVATSDRLIPDAVGGDAGCGMAALRFDCDADRIDATVAARIFDELEARVPILKHRAPQSWPDELATGALEPSLARMAEREGRRQLGTLGRGNHFIELQRDDHLGRSAPRRHPDTCERQQVSAYRHSAALLDQGALWAMIHTGSRAMGGAIRERFLKRAQADRSGLRFLRADSDDGAAYLRAIEWARAYAAFSRRTIGDHVRAILQDVLGAEPDESSWIDVDHNHVRRETHLSRELWVHRKGAMHAPAGALGIIPGSMGSASFHVEGRGLPEALASCSHGAGRAMSRTEARKQIGLARLLRETRGVWIDRRVAAHLREEAPSAYKDVGAVMRAQRELVRIVRRLSPVLVYKGT